MMMGTFDRPPVFPMPDLPRCVVPARGRWSGEWWICRQGCGPR